MFLQCYPANRYTFTQTTGSNFPHVMAVTNSNNKMKPSLYSSNSSKSTKSFSLFLHMCAVGCKEVVSVSQVIICS